MSRFAIVIGVADYTKQPKLACCLNDADAVSELLAATEGYDEVLALQNPTSAHMKDGIRTFLEKLNGVAELLFYFSGHGAVVGTDFYYCPTDFDVGRPNETGLSNEELHTLLRPANADLVVKIVDACESGTLLVKSSSMDPVKAPSAHFKNVIQISSCLNDQESLAGTNLSPFTENLRSAILSKDSGPVYFSDVVSSLRDRFLKNENQTPHFVLQYTAREIFLDNAEKLENIRQRVEREENEIISSLPVITTDEPLPLLERLRAADSAYANAEIIDRFIERVLAECDRLIINDQQLSTYFAPSRTTSPTYGDDGAHTESMVRSLIKEDRPDDFVSVEIHRTRDGNPLSSFERSYAIALGQFTPPSYTEEFEIVLNCKIAAAEAIYSLIPKFRILPKFSLLLTFAPSLEHCYIFERARLHKLYDWDRYDPDGPVHEKRWYKRLWTDSPEKVATSIATRFVEIALQHVENSARDTSKD